MNAELIRLVDPVTYEHYEALINNGSQVLKEILELEEILDELKNLLALDDDEREKSIYLKMALIYDKISYIVVNLLDISGKKV